MDVKSPRIQKVTVHMSIGESGELLQKAADLLEEIVGQKPVFKMAKNTNRDFGIRKGEAIAVAVTLRGQGAEDFLIRAFEALENKLPKGNFDEYGNFAFGIKEHIDLPGIRYDPKIGIFGMDVCVTMDRIGYRIARRKYNKKKIKPKYRISKEDGILFIKERYGVDIA